MPNTNEAVADLQHADVITARRRCRHQRASTITDRTICPSFETGIRLPGQKLWRLLSRVVEPGQNVPHANFFCTLRDSNLRPIAWRMRMASLPTHLSSTCDSVKNNSLLNYHVEGPFVPVGGSTRDKKCLLSRLVPPTGIKGSPFCPGWCYQPGQKGEPFVRVGTSNRDKMPLSPLWPG